MDRNIEDVNNELCLKSIGDLLGYSFNVPFYQRGYRWKKDPQVRDLLEDIWNYKIDYQNPDAFYCLQPVVIKPIDENYFELIDGQQRLLTILLILHYFNETEFKTPKKRFSMQFETRIEQNNFLDIVKDAKLASKNIDLFHINEAYSFIASWFDRNEGKNPSIRGEFYAKLINRVKVIWYEIKDNTSVIDIFTRLNIGKIPLKNSELIKALFLSKSSNTNDAENRALKQISIAVEWDKIEQTMQQPDFGYFICVNPEKYDTRVEFIFDLMKDKKEDHENYYTFYEFHKEFDQDKNNPQVIDKIWLNIKEYFLTFDEWYHDRELYHLVGYLVAIGKNVNELKKESVGLTKTAFKEKLKTDAKKSINTNIEELNYENHNKEIRNVLLLFNILTIISNSKSSIRFPFHYFHTQHRDIEHIRSQVSKDISGKDQQDWAMTVLYYFTGIEWNEDTQQNIANTIETLNKDEEKGYCEKIIKILKGEDADKSVFDEVYNELKEYFQETDSYNEIDSLSNLTLLDEGTNRMYKNAFFPIKRKYIINKEKKGVFIPLCTKNVFLKAYSQKLGEVMYWSSNDADDYLNEIKRVLEL